MWSKLLLFTVTAIFLAAVGTGVMAHDGRISNIIMEPDEVDEHPWGGENQLIDEPDLVASPTFDPFVDDVQFLFIRMTIKHYWFSVKHTFNDFMGAGRINNGTITDTQTITTPSDNNTNNTDQGARNK